MTSIAALLGVFVPWCLILSFEFIDQLFLFRPNLLLGTTAGERVITLVHQHERSDEGKLLLHQPKLLLFDKSVIGMTLRHGAKLRLPKQLPEVLPLVEPNTIG